MDHNQLREKSPTPKTNHHQMVSHCELLRAPEIEPLLRLPECVRISLEQNGTNDLNGSL